MRHKKQIGWQKYEDALEKQLVSPITQMLSQKFSTQNEEDQGLDLTSHGERAYVSDGAD